MNRHHNKALKKILLSLIIFPLASIFSIAISGITPAPPPSGWYNFPVVYIMAKIHIGLLFILFVLVSWREIRKQEPWLLNYLVTTNLLPIYFGGIIYNLISPSLSNPRWLLILAAMYPIAETLPFVAKKLTDSISQELFSPKSQWSRFLLWGLPMMGITGATLSQMARGIANGLIGYAIIGLVFHFLLVWQTISIAQQILDQWDKDNEKREL